MSTTHRTNKLSHKERTISFLKLVTSEKIREAYEQHIVPEFRHHNPCFKGDAGSLMKGMEENQARFPGKILEIQRALEEDDLVAVHSHVRLKPEERGVTMVHIFSLQNVRIVELWDMGSSVPEDSVNECGTF